MDSRSTSVVRTKHAGVSVTACSNWHAICCRCCAAGDAVAAVTVTRVARSAPRGAGATMAVTADGRVIGSISGGCVEADAVALAHSARVGGAPRPRRFGFSDDAAHAAGLACGGSVEVVAYPVSPEPPCSRRSRRGRRRRGHRRDRARRAVAGRCSTSELRDALRRSAAASIRRAGPARAVHRGLSPRAPSATARPSCSACSTARRPRALARTAARLIILGAGEHAAALCRVGAAAGFAVTVCDVWETLVTPRAFPDAASSSPRLPHEYLAALDAADVDARTAVCVLTHDERLDVPALDAALALPSVSSARWAPAAPSRSRAALLRDGRRRRRPTSRACTRRSASTSAAPSPDETAISVLAEIVASRHGGSGAAAARALRRLSIAGPQPRRRPPRGAHGRDLRAHHLPGPARIRSRACGSPLQAGAS